MTRIWVPIVPHPATATSRYSAGAYVAWLSRAMDTAAAAKESAVTGFMPMRSPSGASSSEPATAPAFIATRNSSDPDNGYPAPFMISGSQVFSPYTRSSPKKLVRANSRVARRWRGENRASVTARAEARPAAARWARAGRR
ncbi:hypothetical protein N8I84_14825 [Streptomyces cynarae]|uniref:Uncharacterized protein n=1 Tax=Streptomyces cynarae TaxID=2981134 RepID=A0ABY6DZT7_9ACTN|nr:hypothetical protein [Streptomyces cynarae]UXY19860.1 hypothetical protein N8I84_14825 [Streptomyces cynarae]